MAITALIKAARMGHSDAVRILLHWRADAPIRSRNGQTALAEAIHYEHPDVPAFRALITEVELR